MALSFGFYNSINSDRTYDAIQFGQIFDGIIKDGIYATYEKAMVVIASENAGEVIIQPGRAWFNHTWSYNDANYVMAAPAPDVLLERIDALVLDVNTELAFRENSFVWVEGTASSRPERPTLTNTVTHHQYPLCYVHRYPETTMIYTRDITNAVGTSECPFVTGVLTGLDIDMWINQWDDEFHTWENATRTQFEGWMINQQEVYTTWFNSVRTQMEDNMTEFEAWFETIQGIIDEEAATHLQAEIDALAEMLPAGSHIDIHTTETTLYNRNVTVSDQAGHSKTVKFGATGDATVESFPYVGLLDFVSTDGIRTASSSITTPYFGRYSVTMAFWAATCNLVSDESFAGIVVTVKDSLGDVKGAVTLDQYGSGVYTATYPDEYTFTLTYGGQTMEVSLAVTQETTYEVELHGGFRFDQWLEAGRVEEEFDTLDEILEDEPTLRQLFLVHDSVDYICDTFAESGPLALADITKIFNTDLAAKWINLSDYALDHFYAVDGIKSIMDSANKYGYGEWALMPQVPKMTSNTAPYGTATGDSKANSSDYYQVFDGNASSTWFSNHLVGSGTQETGWIQYTSPNPICAKRMYFDSNSVITTDSVTVKGSNDGTNFTLITTKTNVSATDYIDFENDTEYLVYRVEITQHYSGSGNVYLPQVRDIQFYAWAPKGNVPVMTSNTAPYGTAISTAMQSSDPYVAFDGNSTTKCRTTDVGSHNGEYIGYKFTNPICPKKFKCKIEAWGSEGYGSLVFKIQGSDDGSIWDDLTDTYTTSAAIYEGENKIVCNTFYSQLRLYVVSGGATNTRFGVYSLQFYGRELKGLVPAMTSNTAPYGTVIYSTYHNGGSFDPWRAFNLTDGYGWMSTLNEANPWVGYVFDGLTDFKKAYFNIYKSGSPTSTSFKIQGSNNNGESWDDVTDSVSLSSAINMLITKNNDLEYKRYRVYFQSKMYTSSGNYYRIDFLQFYGVDYSEKEFEESTTKKWLYDHGVELEEIAYYGTQGTITKESNDIICDPETSTTICGAFCSDDATQYSMLFGMLESIASYNATIASTTLGIRVLSNDGATTIATTSVTGLNPTTKFGLSLNSVDGNVRLAGYTYGQKGYLKELWLG